ncbi:retrovirus-related pol polyprotein from transposon TNT 1-94 [Tanacetum coccineum]
MGSWGWIPRAEYHRKARFETHVKSTDIDLWQVIQNDDFYFDVEDSETKMMKEKPEQTSDDSDSQGGSDEDVYEEEAKALNLMAMNFRKFFRKDNLFGRGNQFQNGANSDSEDSNEPQNDATCLMAIDSQEVQPKPSISNNDLDIIDFQKENEELLRFNNNFTKTFEKLFKETRSLESEKSKLLSKLNDLEIEVEKITKNKEMVEPWIQGNATNRTRNEVSTTRVLELLHLDLIGPSPIQSYKGNFYTLMIVDNHSNYTWVVFVESNDDVLEKFKILGLETYMIVLLFQLPIHFSINLHEPKSSPSVEDDMIFEPVVQDSVRSLSLEVNASKPGYPKSLNETRGQPIEQVIGELNERTLRKLCEEVPIEWLDMVKDEGEKESKEQDAGEKARKLVERQS